MASMGELPAPVDLAIMAVANAAPEGALADVIRHDATHPIRIYGDRLVAADCLLIPGNQLRNPLLRTKDQPRPN